MFPPVGPQQPYGYQPPPPPPPGSYGVPSAPPPGYAPLYAQYPTYGPAWDNNREGKAIREITMGVGLHCGIAAGVGGLIGLCIGGPVGAAWGAGIGTALGQGFMQLIARMADGGGDHAPLYAAAPTVVTGLAAWAAGAAWGAGAAAWMMVGVPLALAAVAVAWQATLPK